MSLQDLTDRIGAGHVERRLKVEAQHEAQLFGPGLIFFNLENWYSAPWIIRSALKLIGLCSRARRNADQIVARRNKLEFENLPPAFENFTILDLSDLHVDIRRRDPDLDRNRQRPPVRYLRINGRLSQENLWTIRHESQRHQ
jgi:uncharacterized protein